MCAHPFLFYFRASFKRNFKDKKYGFGGKKKNSKRNNAKDSKDDRPLPNMKKPRSGRGGNKKGPMGAQVKGMRGKGGKRGGPRGKVNKNKGRSRK